MKPAFSAGYTNTEVLEIGGQHGDHPSPNNPLRMGHWVFQASILELPDSSATRLDRFNLTVSYKTSYSIEDVKSVTRYGDKPYTYQFTLNDGTELRVEGGVGVGQDREFTLIDSKGSGLGFKIRSTSRPFRDYMKSQSYIFSRKDSSLPIEIKHELPPPLKFTRLQTALVTCKEWLKLLKTRE